MPLALRIHAPPGLLSTPTARQGRTGATGVAGDHGEIGVMGEPPKTWAPSNSDGIRPSGIVSHEVVRIQFGSRQQPR